MRIAAIPGSLRKDSFNRKLLAHALGFLKDHEVDTIDLKETVLPIYDADIQAAGFPENTLQLIARVKVCDAMIIATPEYNYGTPGGLKNMIDWLSRSPEKPFHHKPVFLMSASTGGFGGIRGQFALRQTLLAFGMIVLPQSITVSFADKAFDEKGKLRDEKISGQIEAGCAELIRVTGALNRK